MRRRSGGRAARTARSPAAPLLSGLTQGYLFQTVAVTTRNGWSCQVTALPPVKGADAGSDSNPETPRPWETRTLSQTLENMGQRNFLFRFIIANASETARWHFSLQVLHPCILDPPRREEMGIPGPIQSHPSCPHLCFRS